MSSIIVARIFSCKILWKLLFIFCGTAFLIGTINCNEEYETVLHNEVACTVDCMEKNILADMDSCFNHCETAKHEMPIDHFPSGGSVELICRDVDSLTLKIERDQKLPNKTVEQIAKFRRYTGYIYLLQIHEANKINATKHAYINEVPVIRAAELSPNSSYTGMANIFNSNNKRYYLETMKSFKTLETEHYRPMPIDPNGISVTYTIGKGNRLKAIVKWKPAPDMVCHYQLAFYGTGKWDIHKFNKVTNPTRLYSYEIDELEFNVSYTFNITGVNTKHHLIKGDTTSFVFRTPPCSEDHGSYSKCAPELRNIRSTHALLRENVYSVNVTWDAPLQKPAYYIVNLTVYYRDEFHLNISGEQNFAHFPEVATVFTTYNILIVAVSNGDSSENRVEDLSLVEVYTSSIDRYKQIVIVSIIVIAVLITAIVAKYFMWNKTKYTEEHKKLVELARVHQKHELEIKVSNIQLEGVTGEGSFGIVYKGFVKSMNCPVAVKMLKKHATVDDKREFLREIEVMKTVEKHQNIVSIVGHSTSNVDKMMLLTEYCGQGSLYAYLVNFRLKYLMKTVDSNLPTTNSCQLAIVNERSKTKYKADPKMSGRDILYIGNPGYDMLDASADSSLTSRHLLQFSRQIADGMSFLSLNKIVHRDLAARNVLVCDDRSIKICDFGLSRDIYTDSIYIKKSDGRLPMKWLALESLCDQFEYTVQSDVWSFGILMFEIVTFGGIPYGNTPNDCLIEYLRQGERISKPSNCSDSLYKILRLCWHENPDKRPTFSALTSYLDLFLAEYDSTAFIQLKIPDEQLYK